jgi:hypothetical protein
MARAVDTASKDCYTLVRFQYGDPGSPSYIAFTNWSFNIPGSPVYTSEPTMEVTVPENDGILSTTTLDISLPATNSWFANLVSGTPQAPVFVIAEEITKPDIGGDTSSRRIFFRGQLNRTIKNYQGKGNQSIAKFISAKGKLDLPMGVPANHHCAWTLFGPGCQLPKAGFSDSLTIDTVDGKVITTTTSSVRTGKFFHRGYIEYEGLRIGIKDWDDSDPDTFYMIKTPPQSWIGKTVTIWAGCDKTLTTCQDRFNWESYFGGMGYAIPAYNPLIENPG